MSTNPVPFRVECKWPHNSYFEVIAAFNAEKIAVTYATDCQAANKFLVYRVTKRGKVLYDHANIAGEAILQKALGAAK